MATALSIERTAILRIQLPPKTGRRYRRGRGRYHQASAPGESPATDTGNLAGSIRTVQGTRRHTAVVTVGAEYAARLEFGDGRVAPRPFLGPAVEQERPHFEARMRAVGRTARGL